jgi:hypothetical protein
MTILALPVNPGRRQIKARRKIAVHGLARAVRLSVWFSSLFFVVIPKERSDEGPLFVSRDKLCLTSKTTFHDGNFALIPFMFTVPKEPPLREQTFKSDIISPGAKPLSFAAFVCNLRSQIRVCKVDAAADVNHLPRYLF